jgi:hypothetical protein
MADTGLKPENFQEFPGINLSSFSSVACGDRWWTAPSLVGSQSNCALSPTMIILSHLLPQFVVFTA